LNPLFELSKKDFLHFLPGTLYLLVMIGFWIYDKFIFKAYYFYEDQADKDFDNWYQYSGFISMTIYFGLSLRYYFKYKKLILQVVSNADDLLFRWIRNYLFAFLSMICIRLVFTISSLFFPVLDSYQGTWWFYLMFSIVLYYIAITGYSNAVISKIAFKLSVLNNQPTYLLSSNAVTEETIIDIEHETFDKIISPEIDYWKSKIEILIQDEKLFENPELTLTDVAKKLKTNAAVISKTINQGFQMNFNDCINNYRIEAVKNRFADGDHKKSTLLGIAFDSGFNSKATFNRAFKKNTGKTPKEYLNQL
jgi:AraC-like DNA-binding protein